MPREGLFSEKKFFVGKYAENEHFRKLLIASNFRFLDKQWGCQSYAMRWSKLWNELVTAMLWGRQMPQVSGSKHSYEDLRCHMWQFPMWKMRKLERKSRFLTCFSSLDWTEKSTRFCRVFSAFIPSCARELWAKKRGAAAPQPLLTLNLIPWKTRCKDTLFAPTVQENT